MSAEEPFLRAICDNINDDLRRLVFADWLDERGDPRSEWVRVVCELAKLGRKDERRPGLEARKQQLEESHRDGLSDWARRFALARIKDKVSRAPESHWLYATGSKHQGRLNPVLSEEEVAAFELEHRATLPEEYRSFLIEVGNGGLGPGDGLRPLTGTAEAAMAGRLAAPFPLSFRSWDGRVERFSNEPGVLYLAAPDEPWASVYLVVTGEDRGLVWGFGHIHGGWIPEAPTWAEDEEQIDKPPRSFLRWYEDWLDVLLREDNHEG